MMMMILQHAYQRKKAMDAIITNDVPWIDFDLDPPSVYANVKVWSAWWAQPMSQRYETAPFGYLQRESGAAK